MSYQVLARKWRPRRFDEMVGQEHVLKALVNALDNNRLHHAYLFTGTRGVGKTSLARLFAKSLNCEQGISSQPCGQCSACREIAEGRFVDLIEVDAASRTKVEDTRELLENVQYAPTQGRFKIYLIDEVHMLSTHSFNALLKTLEEPPPHVKFLLATTDPQKLPVTILSRCLQFNLKNLTSERIVQHLTHVLNEEQIAYEETALWLLARSAEGSMRDALSLTDQAIAFGSGTVHEEDVRMMLGAIDQRLIYNILDAITRHDGDQVLAASRDLAEFSPDYNTVLGDMISLLHRIALAQAVPNAVDNSLGDEQQVRALAGALRAEDVQLFYQIAVMGRKDLPYLPHPREGFEMVLLRMLAFRPSDVGAAPVPPPSASANTSTSPATNATPERSQAAPKSAAVAPNTTASHTAKTESPALAKSEAPEPKVSAPAPKPPEPAPVAAELKPEVVSAPSQPAPVESAPVTQPVAPQAPVTEEPPAYDDVPPWGEAQPPAWDEYEQQQTQSSSPVAAAPHKHAEPTPGASSMAVASAKEEVTGRKVTPRGDAVKELSALTPDDWVDLALVLPVTGMTASLVRNLSLEAISGSQLQFNYRSEQDALLNDVQKKRIQEALTQYFGQPVEAAFVCAEQNLETPAQYLKRREGERRAEALQTLQADPVVQTLSREFGARIDESSVRPLDPAS